MIGDEVHVTDTGGTTYTDALSELSGASSTPVQPSARPQELEGGSCDAHHDGRHFSADLENNVMHVHERRGGEWVQVSTAPTPDDTQGVVVRDGEHVSSASSGRTDGSALVVQDRFDSDDRSEPYPLPTTSQEVVEHDGELITSDESGAAAHDPTSGAPLEVVPETLGSSSATYQASSGDLRAVATAVAGIRLGSWVSGEVPAGSQLSGTLTQLADRVVDSLRDGEAAVELLSGSLDAVAGAYATTDQAVGSSFRAGLP